MFVLRSYYHVFELIPIYDLVVEELKIAAEFIEDQGQWFTKNFQLSIFYLINDPGRSSNKDPTDNSCEECGESFTQPYLLKRHQQKQHSVGFNTCTHDKCGMKFPGGPQLNHFLRKICPFAKLLSYTKSGRYFYKIFWKCCVCVCVCVIICYVDCWTTNSNLYKYHT